MQNKMSKDLLVWISNNHNNQVSYEAFHISLHNNDNLLWNVPGLKLKQESLQSSTVVVFKLQSIGIKVQHIRGEKT